jgi:hypothetical protein
VVLNSVMIPLVLNKLLAKVRIKGLGLRFNFLLYGFL